MELDEMLKKRQMTLMFAIILKKTAQAKQQEINEIAMPIADLQQFGSDYYVQRVRRVLSANNLIRWFPAQIKRREGIISVIDPKMVVLVNDTYEALQPWVSTILEKMKNIEYLRKQQNL